MRPAGVILTGEAKEEYEKLENIILDEQKKGIGNSQHQQLFNSINRAIEQLKQDPQYGIHVPRTLMKKTGLPVTNLWKVNLTGYWRMLYTISGNRVEIICYVLEICDHKRYDKLFGYNKK